MKEDGIGRRGLHVERQIPIPVVYDGLKFDQGFRLDLLVEGSVVVELKCVEKINNAHKKQLLTYLRLADKKLGYLLNFGAALMKDGITRTVHRLPETRSGFPWRSWRLGESYF